MVRFVTWLNHSKSGHKKCPKLFRHFFYPVFKWSEQVIRTTFQILEILDHKTDIICLTFRPAIKEDYLTIWQVLTIQIREMSSTYLDGHCFISDWITWWASTHESQRSSLQSLHRDVTSCLSSQEQVGSLLGTLEKPASHV